MPLLLSIIIYIYIYTIQMSTRRWARCIHTGYDFILNRDLYKVFVEQSKDTADTFSSISARDIPTTTMATGATTFKYYNAPDDFAYDGFLDHFHTQTVPLQDFVGPEFPLLLAERAQIICGLTVLPQSITQYQTPTGGLPPRVSQLYTSDQLRGFGKRAYELKLAVATTFLGNHLSLSIQDLEDSLHHFNDPTHTIVPFMKKNLLYDCIVPFRGTQCYKFDSVGDLLLQKQAVKDATAIASFYTMIGMLCIKFGTSRVSNSLIQDKIIFGNSGLVKIVSEKLSRTRN